MSKSSQEMVWKKFWNLLCIWETTSNKHLKIVWIFQCDCWKMKQIRMDSVKQWKTISCGCKRNYKHWLSWTRFYRIWLWMNQRCYNKNHEAYYRYKNINILWENFKDFKQDMYSSYLCHSLEYWEKNTTIDRIENFWNYSKDNCRWATRKQQSNNTSKTIPDYIIENSI